jgi:hypothetical protein
MGVLRLFPRRAGRRLAALLLCLSLVLLAACGPFQMNGSMPDQGDVLLGVAVFVVFVGAMVVAASDVNPDGELSPVAGDRRCRVINEVPTTFEMVVDGRAAGRLEPAQERQLELAIGTHELVWYPVEQQDSRGCVRQTLAVSDEPGYYRVTLQPLTARHNQATVADD